MGLSTHEKQKRKIAELEATVELLTKNVEDLTKEKRDQKDRYESELNIISIQSEETRKEFMIEQEHNRRIIDVLKGNAKMDLDKTNNLLEIIETSNYRNYRKVRKY